MLAAISVPGPGGWSDWKGWEDALALVGGCGAVHGVVVFDEAGWGWAGFFGCDRRAWRLWMVVWSVEAVADIFGEFWSVVGAGDPAVHFVWFRVLVQSRAGAAFLARIRL